MTTPPAAPQPALQIEFTDEQQQYLRDLKAAEAYDPSTIIGGAAPQPSDAERLAEIDSWLNNDTAPHRPIDLGGTVRDLRSMIDARDAEIARLRAELESHDRQRD